MSEKRNGEKNDESGRSSRTWEGVVVAEHLEVLAVARGTAVRRHDPVERSVPAS